MDGPGYLPGLSEISEIIQTEKSTYYIIFIWNLKKNKTNEQRKIKWKQTQIQKTNWWLPEGRRVEGWVKGVRRFNLPTIKQVRHGKVAYSTRNIVINTVISLYEYSH